MRRVLALLLLVALAPPARAADPRNFEPALSADALLSAGGSAVAPHLHPWAALTASFANDELVMRASATALRHGLLRNRLVTTLAAGLGLFDRLELAVALPLHLTEGASAPGDRPLDPALGDLRLALRARLFGPAPGAAGLGLALALDAALPTGGAPLASDDGLALTPRLSLDWRTAGGLRLALDAAYRVRPETTLDDLSIGHELRFALGAELPLIHNLALLGELLGAIGLAEGPNDPGTGGSRKTPVEALAGLRWRPSAATALTAAAGAGLTSGYGSPDYRVVFGLTLGAPAPAPWREDAVPISAGPDPFAPEPLAPLAPLDAATLDALAAADPDADGDGLPTPADACPDAPEDVDGHADDDGCPDPDNDGDGVLDADDRCPEAAEVFNGVDDGDGCPDEGGPATAGVTAVGGRLEITDSVRFVSGSAALTPAGGQVLDEVATFLRAHPDIPRVRIEGHTDSAGDKEFNVDLAERRAWAVRAYLILHGVDGARLLPKGFGPTLPIASNHTEAGRARNRRVEFHILDRATPPDAEVQP